MRAGPALLLELVLGLVAMAPGPCAAADWPGPARYREAVLERAVRPRCLRGPVPTNSYADPTYVGSSYGLGKPSYYGNPPPLGLGEVVPGPWFRPCF